MAPGLGGSGFSTEKRMSVDFLDIVRSQTTSADMIPERSLGLIDMEKRKSMDFQVSRRMVTGRDCNTTEEPSI